MDLGDFLAQTHAEVREQISDRLSTPGEAYPYEETVFTEVVMEHMTEIGMTFEPAVCHYSATLGNAKLRLSGYAVSEDGEQLDLFVSLYEGSETLSFISDTETKTAADQCLRFLIRCVEGRLASTMEQSNDAYLVVNTIKQVYPQLDQIRIYVLTDRQAKAKNFKAREIGGKTVKLEVMDIERLWRHWSEGKPRDELVVNFIEVCGSALPCVYVPNDVEDYDYALTAIPAEALRLIYEKYGARLLEANVRSFLSSTGKVNKGIRETLQREPERFMAYNNGIVVIADELRMGETAMGSPGIVWLKGMQIVNGGETTASIYFTKKKAAEIDLSRVRVPAKIIILRSMDQTKEEALISDISRYANSQNAVKLSDLSANKPFHVKLEQLSMSTYCPDGVGRWFYERASGSYNTLLVREGTTPARLRKLKTDIPPARRITKTDLAKYLMAWERKPHIVSLGSQKNFERFMAGLSGDADDAMQVLPDVSAYKQMVAKSILFKATSRLVRSNFQAFQANVAAYTISVMSERLGDRIDLDRIWSAQDVSARLQAQILLWAREVNGALHARAGGRMISEWAKKTECWEAVLKGPLSPPATDIPEVRSV
jgi:hypothetical protein